MHPILSPRSTDRSALGSGSALVRRRTATRANHRDPRPSAFPRRSPTSEPTWRRFVSGLEVLDLPTRSTVVVAPHPDDETLACGGAMAHLAALGVAVRVVTVTDGEASHPMVPDLATTRRAEQRRALDALGVTAPVVHLGLPDGQVARHEALLAERLEDPLGDAGVVFAPWSADGHGDHDACGRATRVAAHRAGRRVLAYPVWAWQWARPSDLEAMPWRRWDLCEMARARKAEAIDEFATQVTDRLGPPVVDATALARFRRPCEVFADVG